MAPRPAHVIIGGGLAAARAAHAMRDKGFDGTLLVIAAESHLPYDRPPLSKKVLTGEADPQSTRLYDAAFYHAHQIDLCLGVHARSIDRRARQVVLNNGNRVPYDRLLIATGSRERRLPLPGAALEGIFYLRGLDDCDALRAVLKPGLAIVVVGGGYIGLELAASARCLGCDVTVLESRATVMSRVVAPDVGRWFEHLHRSKGAVIRTNVDIADFGGSNGRVTHVELADGERIAADLVVVGAGSVPNLEIAASAGLNIDNGIVVNDQAQTSDPDIFAAGDVTNHPNPLLKRRIRLESWQNAQNQAIVAAAAMCGEASRYAEVPWFWSDQYDTNLQIVGLPDTWDEVVSRRYNEGSSMSVIYVQGDTVVAANAINAPRDIPVLRRLIQQRKAIDRSALADAAYPLRDMLKR